jgi:hypothetical protein
MALIFFTLVQQSVNKSAQSSSSEDLSSTQEGKIDLPLSVSVETGRMQDRLDLTGPVNLPKAQQGNPGVVLRWRRSSLQHS